MNDINIEDIMKEIKKEIRDKNYDDLPSFSDVGNDLDNCPELNMEFNKEYFWEELLYLRDHKDVVTWRFLKPIGFLGKPKVFIKKVVRKLSKSYVNPIVQDQNEVNSTVYDILLLINAKLSEYEGRIKSLEDQINKLEKKK